MTVGRGKKKKKRPKTRVGPVVFRFPSSAQANIRTSVYEIEQNLRYRVFRQGGTIGPESRPGRLREPAAGNPHQRTALDSARAHRRDGWVTPERAPRRIRHFGLSAAPRRIGSREKRFFW